MPRLSAKSLREKLYLVNRCEVSAALMHSKRRPLYGSAYRWVVNTLTHTKSSVEVVRSVSLARLGVTWRSPSIRPAPHNAMPNNLI